VVRDPAIGPLIATGREAEVFEYGAGVLKLYRAGIPKRSAFREAAVLAIVETFDLPTPRVEAVHRCSSGLIPSLRPKLEADITNAAQLPAATRNVLLGRRPRMPDGDRLCHGDFHPFNVIGAVGKGVIIDWPNATRGAAQADVCRSFVLISSLSGALASDYVDAYARLSGEARDGILAWLPFVAAARLAEGVPDEVDGLFEMIERA
jgi:Phosphotransferase enzyme family